MFTIIFATAFFFTVALVVGGYIGLRVHDATETRTEADEMF